MSAYVSLPSAEEPVSTLVGRVIAVGSASLPSAEEPFSTLLGGRVIAGGSVSLPSAEGATLVMAAPTRLAMASLPSAEGAVRARAGSLADEWASTGFPLPKLDSYTYQRDAGIQRSQMDSGATRQRRRWSNGSRTASVSFEIGTDKLYAMEAFIASKGYDWFGMSLVTSDNVGIAAVIHKVRCISDPTYGDLYGENISVALQIEILD